MTPAGHVDNDGIDKPNRHKNLIHYEKKILDPGNGYNIRPGTISNSAR
jgi:hypothetical protein